jgi:glycoside/pentoside/hexuronide:cation symporter, GPH family
MATILQHLNEMSIPKNVPSLSHKMMALYGLPHLTHSMVLLPLVLFIPSYYADDLA